MAQLKRRTMRGRLLDRWRNASLKTAFAVYAVVFLVCALALSILTASLFTALDEAASDDEQVRGLYLYDADDDALVSAQSVVVVNDEGMSVFMGSAALDSDRVPLSDVIGTGAIIEDVTEYPQDEYAAFPEGTEDAEAVDGATAPVETYTHVVPETLPAYDERARELAKSLLTDDPADARSALASIWEDSPSEALSISPVGYYVYTPLTPEASALTTFLNIMAVLMFPLWFGICAFIVGRRLYRTRIAPGLEVLDSAAANIANRNLDFTVAYDRNDELGRLADSFEVMRSSLAETQRELWHTAEERRRLNAAFAHDLRTPLTILHGKIELLAARAQSGELSPADVERSASALAAQVDRLERYVAAMSGLQKLEDRMPTPTCTTLRHLAADMQEIGESICGQQAKNRGASGTDTAPGVTFELETATAEMGTAGSASPISLDAAFVAEAAQNVIGNAARFAKSRVTARLRVDGDTLVLEVDDDGPGFSPAALEKGDAPFFSETPDGEHFGLGLNIASLLCNKHGGTLKLANRLDDDGTVAGAHVAATFRLSS